MKPARLPRLDLVWLEPLKLYTALRAWGMVVVLALTPVFGSVIITHPPFPPWPEPPPAAPVFVTEPADAIAADGTVVNFSVYVTGGPTPTLSWERRSAGAADWQVVPAGSAELVSGGLRLAATLDLDGEQVRCTATNSHGTVVSRVATLRVRGTPPLLFFPGHPRTAAPGETVTLAPSILGTAPLSFQWTKDDVPIPGAIQPTLELSGVQAADAGVYAITVTNDLGAAKAVVTTLTVTALPAVALVPVYATPAEGEAFTLQAHASGGVVAWWRDGAPLESNSFDYTVDVATPQHAGRYRVSVSNGAGTVWSNEVVVEVLPPAPPGIELDDLELVEWGGEAVLTPTIKGRGPFSYQWYRNGEPIAGATESTLTLTNIGLAELGAYFVAVTNPAGTTLSRTVDVEPISEGEVAAHHWRQMEVRDGVVYFLYADAPRIERYDLATRNWLPNWTLSVVPVAFAFAPDALYVASESEIWRFSRSFGEATRFATSTVRLRSVGVLGDHVVSVASNEGYDARYQSYLRSTGAPVANWLDFSGITADFSYNAATRRVYGRRANMSGWMRPGYVEMQANGNFGTSSTFFAEHTASSGRTWMLSAGGYMVEASGHVWSGNESALRGNFGRITDDAIDDGQDGFVALRHGRIGRFDARFREIGSFDLGVRARRLARHGTVVFGFRQPAASGERAIAHAIDLTQIQPRAAAPAVNAETATGLWSPQVEYDGADRVYVYSRLHRAVLRWSLSEARFDDVLSLPAQPDEVAVAPRAQRLYFALNRTQLWQRDLAVSGAGATPFTGTKDRLRDTLALGNSVYANASWNPLGMDTRQYLFDAGGVQVGAVTGSTGAAHFAWSESLQRLYYVFSKTTPSNLAYRPVSDRTGLGAEKRTPYHTTAIDFSGPLRIDDKGQRIVLASGRVFETSGLTLAGHVLKRLTDATWGADALFTLRPAEGGTRVEAWRQDNWEPHVSVVVPGQPLRIWQVRGDRLLVTTLNSEGRIRFSMLESGTLTPLDSADATRPPEIVSMTSDAQIVAGGTFVLGVSTRGGALPTYQWQVCLAGAAEWSDLADDAIFTGTRTGRLTAVSLPARFSGARFRVVVTNAGGEAVSPVRSVASHGTPSGVALAAGPSALAFVRADGALWTMGENVSGRLGIADYSERPMPKPTAADAVKAVVGSRHLAWQSRDGNWWASGASAPWLPSSAAPELPRLIGSDFADVALADSHALFLRRDGSLWGAGSSSFGQLLLPGADSLPMQRMATGVVAIAAAGSHSLWLTVDGVLWGAGSNSSSQLGAAPVDARGARQIATDVRAIVAAPSCTFFIKRDQTLWWVGTLDYSTGSSAPVQLAQDVRSVSASSTHVVFTRLDGSLWSLGANGRGQLGDGTTTTRWEARPVALAGLRDAVTSGNFTAALDSDGSVWVCGQVSSNASFGAMWSRLLAGVPAATANRIAGEVSTSATAHGVALSWVPIAGIRSYEVWRATSNDLSAASLLRVTEGTLLFDESAAADTTYFYWVRPILAHGTGEYSSVSSGQRGEAEVPRITAHPQDVEKTGDYFADLEFAAEGDPMPALHWEMRAANSEAWAAVPDQWPNSGVRSPRLRVQVTAATTGTQYRGVATNVRGQAYSTPATTTWRPSPFVIWSQPKGGTVIEGKNFTLFVTISGASATPTFQWKKEGTVLTGRTQGALALTSVSASDAGSYTVVVTAPEGTIESDPAIVTVIPEPPKPAAYALGAGEKHSVFLIPGAYNGGMGDNARFQTGTLTSTQPVRAPQLHTRAREFTAIAAGANHTLLLTSTGSVYAIGDNSFGQVFGSQDLTVARATNVAAIAAGAAHTVVLRSDGTVHGIGLNASGQLGGGNFSNRSALTQFATGASDIAAGAHHTLLLKSDRTLWGVGANTDGQLAHPEQTNVADPVPIAVDVAQAAGGLNFTVILKRDGTLWGVGRNSRGQLGSSVGLGDVTTLPAFLAEDVESVAAGAEHLLFIKSDGSLWGLGRNDRGQLGTGEQTDRNSPARIADYAARAAAGQAHSLWIDQDGSIWACGDNASGQVGADSVEALLATPTKVWRATGTAPARPVEMTASDNTVAGGVRVTWQGGPGALHYELWRSYSPDVNTAMCIAPNLRVPFYHDPEVSPHAFAYYWVAAVNQFGRSAFSVRDVGVHSMPSGVPQISYGPNSGTVMFGSSLTLSVGVSNLGSMVMVQWRCNGVAFGPATSSLTLTIPRVTMEHAGEWDAVITNLAGSTVTRVAEVAVRIGEHRLSVSAVGSRLFSPEPFEIGPALSNVGLPIHYTVVSGPAQISGNFLTATGVGAVEVRAEQPGGDIFPPAAPVTLTFAILPAEAQVQLRGLVRAYDGTPHEVTASSIPAVPLTITYDGSLAPPTEVGTYLVRAEPATSSYTGTQFAYLTITKAPQVIAFSPPVYLEADGNTHTLQATSSSALPVSFALAGGQAHLDGQLLSGTVPGMIVLRAAQPGDARYEPAPDVLRSILLLPPNRFTSWQLTRFSASEVANDAVSGVAGDPDNDQLSNLLEFALGRNPAVSDTSPVFEVWRDADGWFAAYSRPAQRPELVYRVESSVDLVNWSDAEVEHTRFSEGSGVETWLAARYAPELRQVFFRLRVELAPVSN
jgi:alpha-tubulin suppressor-like RCC1 family protein